MVLGLKGCRSLERSVRSVGAVLDSILFSQQLGPLHGNEQLILNSFLYQLVNDSTNELSNGDPGEM